MYGYMTVSRLVNGIDIVNKYQRKIVAVVKDDECYTIIYEERPDGTVKEE